MANGPVHGSLANLLNNEKKDAVVSDCCTLIDDEVADKRGRSPGSPSKRVSAPSRVSSRGSCARSSATSSLRFARTLDPIYQEAKSQGKPVASYFVTNSGRVADALLSITDSKANSAKSGVVKGTYDKLRPSAKKHVESAVRVSARSSKNRRSE